jgi:phosphatidylglycerophosphate synthase
MSWYTEYKRSLKMVEVEEYFDLFFYRPLAFLLVKTVYRTNITPNQLTLFAVLVGMIGAVFYAKGSPDHFTLGAIFFMLYNIIDCSDGQLARIKKNGSNAGRIIDGLADYITTAAIFIAIGIGGMQNHDYSPGAWWFLLALTGASNVIQSALVDYYRNRFLDYVLQRKSTFEEGLEAFREEYNSIRNEKKKWLSRFIIRCYFKYSSFQRKLTAKRKEEKLFAATPEEYYKRNKNAVRGWVSIGPTSQVTALIICSLLNRFDVFFWLMIGVFNLAAAFLLLNQRGIDKSFKPITA